MYAVWLSYDRDTLADQKRKLVGTPKSLTVCLQTHALYGTSAVKNSKAVHFPLRLDLASYAVGGASRPLYQLVGAVVHAGEEAGSGHYFAYICKGNNLQSSSALKMMTKKTVFSGAVCYLMGGGLSFLIRSCE